MLLARDKPEIKEALIQYRPICLPPIEKYFSAYKQGSDTVNANPTTSGAAKPDTGEIKNLVDRIGDWETYRASTQHLKRSLRRRIYRGIFRSSGGQKSHLSDKVSPLSDNNTSKRFHKTLSPKIIVEEDDPAKIMQKYMGIAGVCAPKEGKIK